MKRITEIIAFVLALAGLAAAGGDPDTLTFDVGAACRTFVNVPERAGVSVASGAPGDLQDATLGTNATGGRTFAPLSISGLEHLQGGLSNK